MVKRTRKARCDIFALSLGRRMKNRLIATLGLRRSPCKITIQRLVHYHTGNFWSGLQPCKNWDQIGQALLNKGFNREEKDKILGGNFMRMFAEVTAGKRLDAAPKK